MQLSDTQERNKAVISMRADGRTYQEIAKAFDLSSQAVINILRREEYKIFRQQQVEAEADLEFTQRTLEWLPLSYRTRARFRAFEWRHPAKPPTPQLVTVIDLLQWSSLDLLRLHNFGRVCLDEIDSLLTSHGLKLKVTPTNQFMKEPREIDRPAQEHDLLHQILDEVKVIRALLTSV